MLPLSAASIRYTKGGNFTAFNQIPSYLFTASLRAFPALNLGRFAAAIGIASPVLGLRPTEAAQLATLFINGHLNKRLCYSTNIQIKF